MGFANSGKGCKGSYLRPFATDMVTWFERNVIEIFASSSFHSQLLIPSVSEHPSGLPNISTTSSYVIPLLILS